MRSGSKTYQNIGLLIVLALCLRLFQIDLKMRFIWDEARDMAAIYNLVANRDLTLFGPYNEIGGTKDFFGVFHYYLMALPLWIANYDPVGPSIFTALLGSIAVGLVYLIITKWTDQNLALIVAFFLAINPLSIQFSQWAWNPNTTPFFAACYFIVLTFFHQTKKCRLSLTFLAGLLLGLLFQLHYFTFVLGTAMLILLYDKYRQQVQLKKILLSSSLFIIGMILPNLTFIIFDLTHDFFYWKIISASFAGNTAQNFIDFKLTNIVTFPVSFFSQLWSELGFGNVLGIGMFFWMALSCILVIKRYLQTKQVELSTLIVGSLLAFLILGFIFPNLIDNHHLAYLWWGLFFVVLNETNRLIRKKYLLLLSVILLTIVGVNSFKFLSQLPDWSQNMPLTRSLANIIIADLNLHPSDNFNLAALTDADTRGTRYRYFLLPAGFQASGIDQYDSNEIIYVITPHSEEVSKQNPAWELSSIKEISWQLLGTEQGLHVYKANKLVVH